MKVINEGLTHETQYSTLGDFLTKHRLDLVSVQEQADPNTNILDCEVWSVRRTGDSVTIECMPHPTIVTATDWPAHVGPFYVLRRLEICVHNALKPSEWSIATRDYGNWTENDVSYTTYGPHETREEAQENMNDLRGQEINSLKEKSRRNAATKRRNQ